MTTIEEDLLQIIVDAGYGEIGTDLFINELPNEEPDACIAIFATGTTAPKLPSDFEFSFQCRVRDVGANYDDCRAKIFAIHGLFNWQGYSMNGRRLVFRPANPPTFLMYDEANRPNFIFNCRVLTTGN